MLFKNTPASKKIKAFVKIKSINFLNKIIDDRSIFLSGEINF